VWDWLIAPDCFCAGRKSQSVSAGVMGGNGQKWLSAEWGDGASVGV